MNEKLLCKCANSIIAHRVVSVLERENITFRQHDETNDPHTGTYGPISGIAIYVLEEDYEKALPLVEPLINSPAEPIRPFCPKCGNDDVGRLEGSKYATPLLIFSIFLFIAPIAFLYFSKGTESQFMYYFCLATFITSIVIMLVCGRKDAAYKCNHCGKKFNRM